MVYSKVEMPQQYISSEVDGSSQPAVRRKAVVLRKLTEDVIANSLYFLLSVQHIILCMSSRVELRVVHGDFSSMFLTYP